MRLAQADDDRGPCLAGGSGESPAHASFRIRCGRRHRDADLRQLCASASLREPLLAAEKHLAQRRKGARPPRVAGEQIPVEVEGRAYSRRLPRRDARPCLGGASVPCPGAGPRAALGRCRALDPRGTSPGLAPSLVGQPFVVLVTRGRQPKAARSIGTGVCPAQVGQTPSAPARLARQGVLLAVQAATSKPRGPLSLARPSVARPRGAILLSRRGRGDIHLSLGLHRQIVCPRTSRTSHRDLADSATKASPESMGAPGLIPGPGS